MGGLVGRLVGRGVERGDRERGLAVGIRARKIAVFAGCISAMCHEGKRMFLDVWRCG